MNRVKLCLNIQLNISDESDVIYSPRLLFVINVMRASRSGVKAISSPALEPKSKALNIAIPKEKMAYMTKNTIYINL